VLLVDDNVDAMEMMAFLLAEMGYEAYTTADAAASSSWRWSASRT
jgi:CheY-like chemotaxis protein